MAADLDDYSAHEALDRTFLIVELIGMRLLDHPYVQGRPEVQKLIEQAHDALGDAYQMIGADTLK